MLSPSVNEPNGVALQQGADEGKSELLDMFAEGR
jgi:hypothetical protein